jgi:hypothetical protein
MTHTFKYLSKIALVASALSMIHSPSFAEEDVNISAFEDFCLFTENYKSIEVEYHERWASIKDLSGNDDKQQAIIKAAQGHDARNYGPIDRIINLCEEARDV